ncbi:three-Cys-motif partner protein TcmP [Rossellomorea marisflavi]|uniref:Three-Cys-motif partner protein TcmP n=1 Tax=Rossellomorea marisflavi TaxID=189381 RepID=A0A5D4RQS0_9BACI|nr:three-Cys-motif partner protein TcmP [Rossellomorea marisflavi]TYS53099.1 three-Cys-motif partner protein TcmP [Rossellomorea marisflavi]
MSFFNGVMDHSKVKLSILNAYTIPWMRKIVLNRYGPKRCLVIDGFSGKGKYEDGSDGSPLILIKNALDFYNQSEDSGWDPPNIYIFLNELDQENHGELIQNITDLGFRSEDNMLFAHEDYETIIVKLENKSFEDFMVDLLKEIGEGESLIPSFCFVDPFGFSSTPFSLFVDYLQNENSELLLNFIYEETNRFITHPNETIRNQIKGHMGLVTIDELISKVSGKTPVERKKAIIETYTNNLMQQCEAEFVRNFEIKKSGRTKLILFHVTKNKHGLALMKNCMWKHDETGTYTFDDRSNLQQLDFEEILNSEKEHHIELLARQIFGEFQGRRRISIESIEDFVITETIYPLTNFCKPALKELERDGRINNFRGRRRVNSYPAGTIMDFIF